MKKFLVLLVVAVVVLAAIVYFSGLFGKKEAVAPTGGEPTSAEDNAPSGITSLSEQPNIGKFNEYFKTLYLGKIPAGQELGAGVVPQITLVFKEGDQFCTVLEAKKTIPAGAYASALYDIDSKTYVKEKMVFPEEFPIGASAGCGELPAPAGKYEYKAYLNDVPVMVLPFEIK